jgi:hypothetical protein
MRSTGLARFRNAKEESCSSIVQTDKFVTVTATETTHVTQKGKTMFKITTNFDSRKFQRDLERRVREAAEKQVHSKLRDLTARGLRVSFRSEGVSSLNIHLDGPDDLIKEAKQRLG